MTKPQRTFKCLNCGCTNFTRVKPEATFAFAKDYACQECKEQIPAPVPLWGTIAIVLCGAILIPTGGFWFIANITMGHMIGSIIGGLLCLLGVRFFAAGISSYFQ